MFRLRKLPETSSKFSRMNRSAVLQLDLTEATKTTEIFSSKTFNTSCDTKCIEKGKGKMRLLESLSYLVRLKKHMGILDVKTSNTFLILAMKCIYSFIFSHQGYMSR